MNEVAPCEFSGLVWVLHGQVWSLFSPNVSFGVWGLRVHSGLSTLLCLANAPSYFVVGWQRPRVALLCRLLLSLLAHARRGSSLLLALWGWAVLIGRNIVLGLVDGRWAPSCFFIHTVTWRVAYSLWSICMKCLLHLWKSKLSNKKIWSRFWDYKLHIMRHLVLVFFR
jgi:hypothetical protein